MAETYIFSIAGQLLGLLSSPIIQEISLVWGVRDDLRRLKNTVSCVHAVLLDAQERQESSHQLKNWLLKLEDALYRAQDVLEEFEIDALRYKVCDRTILRKVRREFSLSNRIVFRFKMARKIDKIRGEFDEIAADRTKFNLIERFDERVVVHKEMTHSFVRDEDVIGRKKEREKVISFLTATTDDESVSILPIIGLGGMGKTTLSKLVYNDERVVAHFDLKMWVCIPEDFELKQIVKEILKSAKVTNCDNLQLEQLQQCLRENLEGQKYLLIFDDVWNDNLTKWIDLRNLLTGGASGSRILVTTRNQSVASIMGTTDYSIELEGLSHEECLSLFLKWAFKSSQNATRYPRLVEIAASIVKKCKGVPLAVRTLGSILYTKTEEREWINIRDSEIWKIEQKGGDILPVLKLSYSQLSTNLRRCFAFCSIFPKDHEYNNLDLTLYWHANGLLQRFDENHDVEDVGMMYIKKLWSRGFFQDFNDLGGFVLFKMHDFVHDLALVIAGHDCAHLNSQEHRDYFSNRMIRQVSFPIDYFNVKEIPSWLLKQMENIHTFAFPNGVGASKASIVELCISKFKSLRLLDLRESSFEALPTFIGHLKHLKHLDISGNHQIKVLPSSICELVGLECLDFSWCLNIQTLPRGLGQLIRLRTLGISTNQVNFPEDEIRCLTSLRHLSITDCPNLKFVMSNDAMQCLSVLRALYIARCGSLVYLPVRGLRHLTRLETLIISDCGHLKFTTDNCNSDRAEMKSGVREEGLHSLMILSVSELPKLESLPLWLLHGANNIKCIHIRECHNMKNLMPEQMLESLKSLQRLWIVGCSRLKFLPEEISFLADLNEVKIAGCAELVSRCQREIGEDWYKICHVPIIYLDYIKI